MTARWSDPHRLPGQQACWDPGYARAVNSANLVVLTGDQVAALNGAVFAVLALLAANDGLAVAKGSAAAARIAAKQGDA